MVCFLYRMGEVFGKLPSEILREADTFDMQVYDIVQTLRDHERSRSTGQASTAYSDEQLLEMLQRVKS